MQHWTFDVNRWLKSEVKKMMDFDEDEDYRRYTESEAILDELGPSLDASRREREEWLRKTPDELAKYEELLKKNIERARNSTDNATEHLEPKTYRHETQPAFGEHSAWQEWYIEHSNCGGTWVYVKDPCNPRVQCSCSMGMRDNV